MKFKKETYGNPVVNQLIAKAEGQKTHSRPYAWVGNNQKYSHITGGIVLPTFDVAGYLITMGVRHETNIMDCIDEFESNDPYKLIAKAQGIQKDYGDNVIANWWGNPAELMSLVNEKNIAGNPVFISAPIDADQKDAFQIYTARLRVALSETYKTLFINKCSIFKNYINAFIQDKTAKSETNPAMYIVGALVHTILLMRPWETAVERIELIPTTSEEYARYADKQAERDIYAEIYGGAA